jgi:hypothetical protein
MMTRKCKRCGEVLHGRLDQKFCRDSCKSAYHYEQNREKEGTLFRKIDRKIKINRRLLKAYNKAGKSTVRSQVLHQEGFDPGYFTHVWRAKNGNLYFFCYEFGFMKKTEHNRRKYVLVHWQDYMREPSTEL